MGGSLEGGDAVVLAVDLDPGVLFDTRGSRVETAPPCCSVHPPEPRPRYSLHLASCGAGGLVAVVEGELVVLLVQRLQGSTAYHSLFSLFVESIEKSVYS